MDENDEISKEDFFKFAIDTKLLDFGSAMGDGSKLQKQKKALSPKIERKGSPAPEKKSSEKVLYTKIKNSI